MADYKAKVSKDQQGNVIPGSSSRNYKERSTSTLLPDYFQSDLNKKILSTTLDKLNQSGDADKISAFIGKKTSNIRNSTDDLYFPSKNKLKNRYQLDPTVVSQDPSSLDYEKIITYDDVVTKLKYLDSNVTNLDKLFADYNYSWTPPINYDMFVNWNRYVWMPYGLPLIGLHGETKAGIEGKRTHTTSAQVIHGNRTLTLENGMRLAFSDDNKIYRVSGVGEKIILTDESTLIEVTETSMGIATPTQATGTVDTSSTAVASPTLGVGGADYVYPPFFNVYDVAGDPGTHSILQGSITNGVVDSSITITVPGTGYTTSGVQLLIMGGQKRRPEKLIDSNKDVNWNAQYITISRECRDSNAWSRSNNWYHIDTVRAVNTMLGLTQSFKIDGTITDDDYAQRPIICWERDLQLYDYGTLARPPVAMVISSYTGSSISGNYDHEGYTVQTGDRVLLTTGAKINKICTVEANGALTDVTNDLGRSSADPVHGDIVTIRNGTISHGKDYRFDGPSQTWIECQTKSIDNIHPKFDLYDSSFSPLSQYADNDFLGSTVFEFLEDTTTDIRVDDPYLKFPLTYNNSSYLNTSNSSNIVFNNSIRQTIYQQNVSTSPVEIIGFYYLKKYNRDTTKYSFDNCWTKSHKQVRVPITVTQDVTSATTDLSIDLGTTNYEPERDYWIQATATGWEFYLKSVYGFEKLDNINPTLYLAKNKSYTFEVTNGATNFQIQDSGGTAYSGNSTVTNNNNSNATVTFAIASNETNNILYYSAPGSTTGKIIIVDEIKELGWPEVIYNGEKLIRNKHYTFNGQNVVIPYESGNSSYAQATSSTEDLLKVGDIVDVKFYTTDTDADDNFAYDVPNNLKNNSSNYELGRTTYSEVFNHFVNAMDSQPELSGTGFGTNNFRNIAYDKKIGGIVNQQVSPMLKLGLTLADENYDTQLALDYVSDSYNVFKKKFIQKIDQLNQSMVSGTKLSVLIDQALNDINVGKNNTFPFANSDMAYYFNMVEKTYTAAANDTDFNLPRNITRTNQYKNHVYVYKISTAGVETFLTNDLYTLDTTSATNKIVLNTGAAAGEKIVIKVSIDEGLSFIPPTLAKLGVTPATKPISYVDETGTRTVVVIEGHDGSKTVAFNSNITLTAGVKAHTLTDIRDQALFELENRIYDHIQSSFKNKRKELSLITGKYRTTPYTLAQQNAFYDDYFNAYKNEKGITSLKNSSYDANNAFTHNYSSTQTEGIGFWRGIYKYYFDTDRPHTHPWEMLGFTEKPSWWDAGYGSPTTTTTDDNCWANATKKAALESALQKGIISEPGQAEVQDINVARPSATFPVSATGTAGGTDAAVTLQDPVTWGVSGPTTQDAMSDFTFGDGSPIETVWNRSVLFPAIEYNWKQSARPTEVFEKNYDTLDRINDGITAVTIKVTVALKSGSTSLNAFYLDGVQQKRLVLQKGITYTFDVSDTSTDTHPFFIGTSSTGGVYTDEYTSGVTNSRAITGSLVFEVPTNAPDVLYYNCGAHTGMGGTLEIIDVVQDNQIISNKTKQRHNSDRLYVHNETDTTNLSRRVLGIQQPIVDRLMYLGNQINKSFAKQLKQLKTQLAFRMEGYSAKSSVSLLADSLPSEKSNNFIPEDDITIKFYTSSPYKYYSYSGVEIIKTQYGFKVVGWDTDKPYFNTLVSLKSNPKSTIIGSTEIVYFSTYSTDVVKVPYGTEFSSANDVYNFLLEYSKYLESQGFIFESYNNSNVVEDYSLGGSQFIIWSETNFDTNTSIQISPAGNKVYLNYINGHAKSNLYSYGSVFKDIDGRKFDGKDINFNRQTDYVSVSPKDSKKAIYFAKFVICDYEHVLLINNRTIFDDIVYEPIFGSVKPRFKIEYLKTPKWNGTLNAPGYIVNGDTIYENFDKSIDNVGRGLFDVEQTMLDTNLINNARKNVGYEKKEFLRNMRLSDDTQFQFMKGVSHLKGTPEVFDRLTRSTFLLESSVDIDLEEEWIFRLAEFGPTPPQNTKEFKLNNTDIKSNPQLINFGGSYAGQGGDVSTDTIINMLPGDGRWLEQPSSNPAISFGTREMKDSNTDTFAEEKRYLKDLPNAGFLKLTEATYKIYNLEDIVGLYDGYKNDSESVLYHLVNNVSSWKDFYSYPAGQYVRRGGRKYQSQVAISSKKSINGTVNSFYTTTYSDGSLNTLRIEKVVFSSDGSRVAVATDPFSTSAIGLEARFGAFDTQYYGVSVRDSSNTSVDTNGDYYYTIQFAQGTVPSVNVPANDSQVYLSAFQWKASSSADDPWSEVTEGGVFSVWAANASAQGWEVLALQDDSFNVEQICKGYETGNEALVKLNKEHNLSIGDYVFITDAELNPSLNGIHKVTGFPTGSDCATCGLRSAKQFYIDEFVNDNENYGKVFIFRPARFDNPSSLTSTINNIKWNWPDGWLAFVDNSYVQQSITIGQRAISDAINTAYTTLGATSINEYTLGYTISTKLVTDANDESQRISDDILVHMGETAVLVPAMNSSNLANWTINEAGDTITFNSGTIGSNIWVAGKGITVYFVKRPLGYGVYSYNSDSKAWVNTRSQQLKADTNQINNVTVYDYSNNTRLGIAEVWDPYKGMIPGIAEKEIDIIASDDKALYSSSTDTSAGVVSNRFWTKEEEGTTWWDLNTVRYLDYEIANDLDYTFKNWGQKFPGSIIDVYEWTRSTVPPDEWIALVNGDFLINDVISSGEAYYKIIDGEKFYYWSENIEYNNDLDEYATFYYFWVKNKTSVPRNRIGRELSTKVIAEYINDPTSTGILWASPGGTSNIITGNIGDYLSNSSVFQINFRSDVDNTNKEWVTIRENDNYSVPTRFAERLHESLLGVDFDKVVYKIAGTEQDQQYTYDDGSTQVNYNAKKIDYTWSNTSDYSPQSIVTSSGDLYRTPEQITLYKTNLKLSTSSSDTEIRLGAGSNSQIKAPAVVIIDPPSSSTSAYQDTTALAYPHVNSSGVITGIEVVRGGLGYSTSSPPTVFINPPQNGTGATATATVSSGGIVTGFNITDGGTGYKQKFIKIDDEILEVKYFNYYDSYRTIVDVDFLTNGGFESATTSNWTVKNGTLSLTTSSPLEGTNSGEIAVSSQQYVYAGQRSIDITGNFSAVANTTYVANIMFKSSVQLTSAVLRYGSNATDVDYDNNGVGGWTIVDVATQSSPAADTVYSLVGEFTTTTDQYHSLHLYVNAGTSQSFTLTVDNLEWINVASGDRFVVTRGQQSTSAASHNQFVEVTKLGDFDDQPWITVPNYTWIDDQSLEVSAPNLVPDLNLNEIFRYGNQIRPFKQSWIKDRLQATRVFVDKANELLLKINLSDSQLDWQKRLGGTFLIGSTSYTPADYWEYTDWFDTNYNIDASSVAQITVSTRNELYDVDSSTYTNVRVDDDNGDGAWAFYRYISNQWLKIGKQNGTIQLKTTLYAVSDVDNGWDSAAWDIAAWDKSYLNEFTNILEALKEDVFIKAYKSYWKQLFFTMIEYIHSEQSNLDWVAKTTFLQLNRKTPGELKPRTFDIGAEKEILSYLDLVKPYHSKVETIFDTRTFNEESNVTTNEVLDIRVQTNSTGAGTGTVTAGPTYSVNSEETKPRGITFNNDGTKMFIVGTTGDDVNEYTLSTGFDLGSTVTHAGSFDVSSQEGSPMSVKFNADGTKMFITGTGSDDVHQYELSSGFDVSTASFTQSKVLTVDTDIFGLDFKPDGTKMYLTGNNNDKIYEFDLSSAFDISTATFNQDLNISSADPTPFGIEFNPDGTRLFIVATAANGVDVFHLSTAWDISTATQVEFYSTAGNPSGIHLSPDGTKMFIVGDQTKLVKSYTLSDAYAFTDTTVNSRAFRMFIDDAGTRKYEGIIDANKTALNGAITATATSITVANAGKLTGTSGTIVIGSERITFTGVSSNILEGCTRGVDGTVPQAHANSAPVTEAGTIMNLTLATDPLSYPAFNSTTGASIAGATTIQGLNVTKGTI